MKRIATMQDLSCIGTCSLAVALPVLSAIGLETAVIPTAVLSAHTAFRGVSIRDLTDDIPAILAHWERESFRFDAVYSGYLASARQIEYVERLFALAAPGALRIVDPAMADGGRLYSGFDASFPDAMKELCARADVILPNLTEACLLSGTPYRPDFSAAELQELARKLSASGARYVILTGVSDAPGRVGALGYDREEERFFSRCSRRSAQNFHGTGDLFSSVVAGAMTRGFSPDASLTLAVDFTAECIRLTQNDSDRWYGVNFEPALPFLIRRMAEAEKSSPDAPTYPGE